MNQIIQPLKDSSTVLLASHSNPDGDAIGSLVAMGLALEKRPKTENPGLAMMLNRATIN